jgi:O-antigen/teichoic acid export membrane protein
LISLLVGEKWAAATPVLRALCPAGLILCLGYLDRNLIVARGRPRLALGWTAVGVGLRLVGYIVGVQFGLVGVAVGLSVTSIIFWPIRLLVIRSLTAVSLPVYARQLARPAVAVGVMVSAVFLTRSLLIDGVPSAVLLFVEVALGGLTYAAVLAIVDRRSLREMISLLKPPSDRGARRQPVRRRTPGGTQGSKPPDRESGRA